MTKLCIEIFLWFRPSYQTYNRFKFKSYKKVHFKHKSIFTISKKMYKVNKTQK